MQRFKRNWKNLLKILDNQIEFLIEEKKFEKKKENFNFLEDLNGNGNFKVVINFLSILSGDLKALNTAFGITSYLVIHLSLNLIF
jgi:hypothetical protein